MTACQAKIHRARVTEANLNYIGSITIDRSLIIASGIQPYQMVHINNLRNGAHWETYVLPGTAGKGDICLNGPPARHFKRGDIVIIVAYCMVKPSKLKKLKPVVVFVNKKNVITDVMTHDIIPIKAISSKSPMNKRVKK